MRAPIAEGFICGIGLLALAAIAWFMGHSNGRFWIFLALVGIAALFEVFYLRSRK